MRSPAAVSLLFAAAAPFALVPLAGCDELNKPMRPIPHPQPPAASSASAPDGGEESSDEAGAPAPAPTITAAPGDIQI